MLKTVYALSKLARKEGSIGVLGDYGKSLLTGTAKGAIEASLNGIRSNYAKKRINQDAECPHTNDPTNIIGQEE